jgi:hypothetical protein
MNTPNALEERVRHALRVVAETVDTEPREAPTPARPPRGGRRRKWYWIGAGVLIPPAVAAAAYIPTGPEYVDNIPRETILLEGEVDGDRYLLVESRRTECGKPVTGVELVEEDENLLGSEWNTIGTEYGERLGANGCELATSHYLANPALYNDGGTQVGDSMVWQWAVHPDVTAVRVTTDGSSENLRIYSVDGAGYALYEIPHDVTSFTTELMIGDDVVPGSTELQSVPDFG